LVCATLTIGTAQKVSANTSISPTWLEFELQPDSISTSGALLITNSTQQQVSVTMNAYEIRQENEFGSVSFVTQPQIQATTFNTFFTFEPQTFILQPNENKKVMVQIRNSADLSPGGHYASLIAKLATDESLPQPRISPALSTLVLLRKSGGEQYQMSLTNLQKLPQGFLWELPKQIDITFQNDGNVHDRPYGRIEVIDMFGRVVQQSPINVGSAFVLPQNRRQLTHQLQGVELSLPFGIFKVHIDGRAERGQSTFIQDTTFFYFDWRLFIGIVTFTTITVFWFIKYQKKHHA
jgi:hypothetical protein